LAAAARAQSNKKAREQAEETLSECIAVLGDAARPVTTYFKQFLAGEHSNQWINKDVAAQYRDELIRLQ
jgi:2-C-methyl-D-erythritol 4-phosphate cytidylyltransferase